MKYGLLRAMIPASVCLYATRMNVQKTAEQIEIAFRVEKHCIRWGPIPDGEEKRVRCGLTQIIFVSYVYYHVFA